MIHAAVASDRGKVRSENQDACLVDLERGLFILADGMGGHQGGKFAASAVITILPKIIQRRVEGVTSLRPRIAELILQESVVELNERLLAESAGRQGLMGMGATVALAWLPETEETAYLAHLGDSRIYRFRGDRLKMLTEDHSIVALLVKHGEISAEEVNRHPARSQLSRFIGMDGEAVPDVQTVSLQGNDRLLLCSDGLTGMVPDEAIALVLVRHHEGDRACQALVDAANEAGGKDNISVIIIDV